MVDPVVGEGARRGVPISVRRHVLRCVHLNSTEVFRPVAPMLCSGAGFRPAGGCRGDSNTTGSRGSWAPLCPGGAAKTGRGFEGAVGTLGVARIGIEVRYSSARRFSRAGIR